MPRLWRSLVLLIVMLVASSQNNVEAQDNGGNTQIAAAATPRVFLPISVSEPQSSLSAHESEFIRLTQDLLSMEDLFGGGNGIPVTFDSQTALQRGMSKDSVALAEELRDYTNELITTAQRARSDQATVLDVDVQKYPRVQAYFKLATNYHSNAHNHQMRPTGWCNPWLSDAACTCGHWGYPQPPRSAPWRDWTSSNPAGTLSSWGYHQMPDYAGGGWTRPQTHSPALCGDNTFRDHAYITGSTTFREQNYNGFTPRGEPNPEVWAGGPWPYDVWPAYVQWWHANF